MKLNNRRLVVGPRGGRVVLPVTCATCVAVGYCKPAPCTAPWGCDSWVDLEGHRVVIEAPAEVEQGELFVGEG